ncbi:hypothetical protein ACIRPK_23775 [Kitasatospora sp. NPDC101801]|uniref:hypothetical protein n=1 Tax=Kitasatospora sp. NPDC101801 TaxID=3364103 RepID=UPI00382552B4
MSSHFIHLDVTVLNLDSAAEGVGVIELVERALSSGGYQATVTGETAAYPQQEDTQ